MDQPKDDGSRKVKNIVAIVYLLFMLFLVGGTYLNQEKNKAVGMVPDETAVENAK
jgi:hypothetical protein